MNGFTPYEPTGGDSFSDWAQKMHREITARRRINYHPDVLISHTTQGVFVRPKPCICASAAEETDPRVTHYDFELKIRFPGGGGSDATELYDLVNVVADSSVKIPENPFSVYQWPSSGFRLTRRFGYPVFISLIVTFRNPVPPSQVAVFGPNGGSDYTASALFYNIAPIDPYGGHWDDVTEGIIYGNAGLGYLQGPATAEEVIENADKEDVYTGPILGFGTREFTWGGCFTSFIIDDPLTGNLFGSAREARTAMIPAGSYVHLRGIIQNELDPAN